MNKTPTRLFGFSLGEFLLSRRLQPKSYICFGKLPYPERSRRIVPPRSCGFATPLIDGYTVNQKVVKKRLLLNICILA